VFLNSGISIVFGDKIVFYVNNTEVIQYKLYLYLTITNQNKFSPTSSIGG